MTDVQKLRALLAVATARPWRTDVWYGTDDGGWAAIGPHCVASEADGFDDAPESVSYDQAMADAALIAGAVNALPELLDEVERLRTIEAQAAAWRSHTEALVAAMKTWGTWEDGVPSAEDCGEVGKVGAAFDAALAALKGGE